MSKVTHNKRYNSGNEDSPKLRGQKPQLKNLHIFVCFVRKKLRYFIPKNVRLNCDL